MPGMQEIRIRSLGREDPLEKEMVREQKYHQLMKKMMIGLAAAAFAATACGAGVETWRATELAFEAGTDYNATGADAVTFDAVFTHESGEKVSRPGFWDGGKTFRVRFAPISENFLLD